MSDDDSARRAILARRARFIAAAMVGAGVVGCERCSPEVCLKIAPQGTSTVEPRVCLEPLPPPTVCLSPPPLPPPDGTDAGIDDAGARDAGAPRPCLSPRPRVCLSKPPQKPPQVCLSYVP